MLTGFRENDRREIISDIAATERLSRTIRAPRGAVESGFTAQV